MKTFPIFKIVIYWVTEQNLVIIIISSNAIKKEMTLFNK